ncbi:NUDIX domain-containing protein [Nocardia alni]|uniref:NUDIX domain-containing protein n=1 Tax=Nocardia alni TaxID=2815723 RepID=UPI0034D78B4F
MTTAVRCCSTATDGSSAASDSKPPAASWSPTKPQRCARRELLEETGFEVGHLELVRRNHVSAMSNRTLPTVPCSTASCAAAASARGK